MEYEVTNKELIDFLLEAAEQVKNHHIAAALHRTISRIREQDTDIDSLSTQVERLTAENEGLREETEYNQVWNIQSHEAVAHVYLCI